MELLLIWYKPSNGTFNYKLVRGYYSQNYYVGQENYYGHILVNIFAITEKGLFQCDNFNEFKDRYYKKNELDHRTFKNKLIDKFIEKLIDMKN